MICCSKKNRLNWQSFDSAQNRLNSLNTMWKLSSSFTNVMFLRRFPSNLVPSTLIMTLANCAELFRISCRTSQNLVRIAGY